MDASTIGGRPLSGGNPRQSAGFPGVSVAQSLARRLASPYHLMKSLAIAAPDRLRIAPPDIRTADPTVADQIYAGCFSFAGQTATVRGVSPFSVSPPSAGWRRALTGFSWLRHLGAADKALADANAKALVADFLAIQKFAHRDPAMEPAVVARRMLSFLTQSPTLLDGAQPEFYDAFMQALAGAARILSRALAGDFVHGAERALCAIALVEFAVCAEGGRKIAPQATRALTIELDRQVLPDGGHISRNPQISLDLLLDLIPLRQVIAARGLQTPPAMLRAIDRMMPCLRMLQHGEGSLALFNGMGATAFDRLANALAFEDTRGAAPVNAPYAGYQRVEARDALLLVDAGEPPPREFSRQACAGALSFEFSLSAERVVVNCGAPAPPHDNARTLSRATAAHSTLTIGERSSARIAPLDARTRLAGRVLSRPAISVERRNFENRTTLTLSHDGYAREFGLIHQRDLTLTHDGEALVGYDRLAAAARAPRRAQSAEAVLRFHLHPRLRAARNGDAVDVFLSNGARVLFSAEELHAEIEESIFFAALGGARKCAQIVLRFPAQPGAEARWLFRRMGPAEVPLALDV